MNRRDFIRLEAAGVASLFLPVPMYIGTFAAKETKNKPNILFIAVDDLRPELGCYGNRIIKSPNIDRLAKEGILFSRAYCQQAICGPSRASLMTGLRPDSCKVTHNETYFRNTVPEVITLPQHFRQHGYTTISIGKIYHGKQNDPEKSWSRKPFFPVQSHKLSPEKQKQVTVYDDVPDNAYKDGHSAEEAVRTLRDLKGDLEPFFLGVGFYKPHLSFRAPKKYWDLYDPDQIELTDGKQPPEGAPSISLHCSYELRVRDGVPDSGPIDAKLSRHLMHGYYACVSYVDAQIGKILDELERLQLRESTIIMLWGDHGWHLGDYDIWGKATNYEIATRVPLIVSAPGMKASRCTSGLVEFLDMYPTLCELASLPVPSHVEGKSFMPLLNNPDLEAKSAAFSQFPCPALREWAARPFQPHMRKIFKNLIEKTEVQIQDEFGDVWSRELFENHLMGYTMRTDRYRFVRWVDVRNPEKALAVELYDHQTDSDETVNLAENPDYSVLVKELETQMIQAGISSKPVSMQ